MKLSFWRFIGIVIAGVAFLSLVIRLQHIQQTDPQQTQPPVALQVGDRVVFNELQIGCLDMHFHRHFDLYKDRCYPEHAGTIGTVRSIEPYSDNYPDVMFYCIVTPGWAPACRYFSNHNKRITVIKENK